MKPRLLFLAALFSAVLLSARLTVERQGDNFIVKRDGKVLIDSVTVKTGVPMEQAKLQRSEQTLPNGTRVWERWCEEHENRFRLEVAKRADGAVEITMAGEIEPGPQTHSMCGSMRTSRHQRTRERSAR